MKELDKDMTFASRDEFRREPVADQLISLLRSEIEISPLVIDGDWGTGKTEFCTKLKNKLESTSDFRAVYIDAFKADHADDPLMTILSAILSLVDGGEKENLRKKALPVLRFGAKVAGKALVSHFLRTDPETLAADFSQELDKASDDFIDSAVRTILKDHEEAEANINALQDTLASIAEEKPIVIFIDELDRCRPDFAVQMLELIKHTFDVTGVQFVLVTNMKQLTSAVHHAYGVGEDAKRYLEKFIKFRCVLPERFNQSGDSYSKEREASIEHLRAKLSASKTLEGTKIAGTQNRVAQFAEELSSNRELSLREVETFVRHLEIYHQLTQGLSDRQHFGYTLISIFAVFVYCFDAELTRLILTRNLREENLSAGLGLIRVDDFESRDFFQSPISIIAYFICRDIEGSTAAAEPPGDYRDSVAQIGQSLFGPWGIDEGQAIETLRDAIVAFSLGAST
ncbi:KAP family P-loop NTPase fold protein [Aliidiomarina maris]|uniref:AAA family ATPase n=1 Tax=Aliidiomarina maris TaxID=531312 RepID=A0A327WVL2_9GAMM|nr:P-loop NTPase fold protein [Aliidiomarina maris]RAJ97091.1 KAP-like P-loop domain-containing protein [Aliidiomarina maris]RUO24691.1 AAA family ATPase [Aliidiomarina maris]